MLCKGKVVSSLLNRVTKCHSQSASEPASPPHVYWSTSIQVCSWGRVIHCTDTDKYVHAYNHFPYVAILFLSMASCLCHLLSSNSFFLLNLNENRECLSQSGSQPVREPASQGASQPTRCLYLDLLSPYIIMCSGGESTL